MLKPTKIFIVTVVRNNDDGVSVETFANHSVEAAKEHYNIVVEDETAVNSPEDWDVTIEKDNEFQMCHKDNYDCFVYVKIEEKEILL